jgi:4a-hydroxytetrahydrobiopterin dehydratase
MQKYNDEQVQQGLAEASGWQLDANGEIFKQYQFANFVEALAFVNKIGALAEEMGHHPDITINYNRVKLSVTTHDAGGLSELDFKLANRANDLNNAKD